jgi:hypothetical protein
MNFLLRSKGREPVERQNAKEVKMPYLSHLALTPQGTKSLSELLNRLGAPPGVNVGLLERLVSLVLGITLLVAITRRFLLYLGLAVIGGFLFYRGVTGYCPLYAAEQIDTRNWDQKLLGFGRSTQNEQDNHARQVATSPWQPENKVGQPDR